MRAEVASVSPSIEKQYTSGASFPLVESIVTASHSSCSGHRLPAAAEYTDKNA